MDKVAEIKRIYQHATRRTIEADLQRAITLLKAIEKDEDRERAAVFMEGLALMRKEWRAVDGK